MTENYLCIHCHFYQPPRENPWLEAIDYQESAAPYHDWNERINAECYNPNGQSRILDDENRVVSLTNNYSHISFNFGPTLLSWLEENDPSAYESILEGDRLSIKRFGGHGSALAQGYNHIIMPLANRRDKETQIKWGLADFEKRFCRKAEGMWLPETAVDHETLEIMADHGLKYVILAPRQAKSFQSNGENGWTDVSEDILNTRRPYTISLSEGRNISAFFYDGKISQAVAFEGLLNNGEAFAKRLTDSFIFHDGEQILNIATDGESYGHHHRHGDMALAYALDYIEKNKNVALINYGQYLEKFPPKHEVLIHENSSWSCVHGVERWRSDCGCKIGAGQDWNQKWRHPLREAMDYLRDEINDAYETSMSEYTADPWSVRNDYISLILDRSNQNQKAFLEKWLKSGIDTKNTETVFLKMLELQRNLLLIYTSCAWFFDEISGTEAVQNLQYAVRAIELARDVFDIDLEEKFLAILQQAPSNIAEFGNGEFVYNNLAQPSKVDFLKLSVHLAASSLFKDKIKDKIFYCFDSVWHHVERSYFGNAQIICAHLSLKSQITQEQQDIEFVVIHLGDQNINIGALPYSGQASYKAMVQDFIHVFNRGDVANSLRLLDKYFENNLYSLNDLFRDQKKEIIDIVFSQSLEGLEEQLKNVYVQYSPIMRYLSDINIAQPPVFLHLTSFIQSRRIERALEKEEINFDDIERRLKQSTQYGINLNATSLQKAFLNSLKKTFSRFDETKDIHLLKQFLTIIKLITFFPFPIDTGEIQHMFAVWRLEQSFSDNSETNALVDEISEKLQVRLSKN